ncbi:MAG: ATP-binding protein [Lachnospiraceae bacterium]|nr:ATP-binding protein [Lachnospiraceae bacterium]
MKQKINKCLFMTAMLGVIATLFSMTFIFYTLFQRQVKKDLQVNAEILAASGVFRKDVSGENLDRGYNINGKELRVTWIDTDGRVLYDNDARADELANHGDRPEVQEALTNGTGECVRKSDTMKMDTFYYALRLSNGTVLRVSTEARSILNMFLTAVPIILLILVLIIGFSVVLAHFLTRQLLSPIKVMAENIEDTAKVPAYKELVPFVNTIRAQHENILMAAKVRQDFTANVSHELKTPLTAISGYAELIENHMVDPGQETRFAQEIQQNANRLLSLINDIIRLSELDSKEGDALSSENIDLDEVARECVKGLQVNAQKQKIALVYDGNPCQILANRDMMQELIDNLGQNAIRYNNEGGYVNIRVLKEDGRPELLVEDNGIGIPKDQQERVFERFYRVDKSRSKQTGGTGLGLAIVKHIVALHDAEIQLESEPGKGTTIRVLF